MVKKKKKSRGGVTAMEDDAPAVVESAAVPDGVDGGEGKASSNSAIPSSGDNWI